MHRSVFRSADNGEHVNVQYTSTNLPETGEMMVGTLVGDVAPGALYNYIDNELWRSFDYGESWISIQYFSTLGRFTSGCIEGELFRCCADIQGAIWRSVDSGNVFF